MRKSFLIRTSILLLVILIGLAAAAAIHWHNSSKNRLVNTHKSSPLLIVESDRDLSDSYDVIVAGTDPEGITAAISAARNGLHVLLADGRNRTMLGGLTTEGGLNMLDLNFSPKQPKLLRAFRGRVFLNEGIFQEWYDRLEGYAFDTTTAANAFYEMVRNEPNIDLLMKVKDWKPIVDRSGGRANVTGMTLTKEDGSVVSIRSRTVIDATQDGDIYAMAGAGFTLGREDIGDKNSLMASTLMIRMSGVTQEIWEKMGKHPQTGIDRMSIWGYRDASEYKPSDPTKVKLRGLNIGRQNDGTLLINAMQLFNVNPLDPESVRQGLEVGRKEAPRIAEFLRTKFPEFKDLKYAGTAEELYTRESRHLIGMYRLTLADVMENRSHWDDIAYGSYAVDIQSTSNGATGTILLHPLQYGVPFRCLVPVSTDGILVVGRSASYDTVPHGSARVVPLGMATGQAAGAAAKLALDRGVTFAELSRSKELVAELRKRLEKQGMDLTAHRLPEPDYMKHKQYKGLLVAAGMYLASGGEDNKGWNLDSPTNKQRFFNNLSRVKSLHPDRFGGDMTGLLQGIADPAKQPISLDEAAEMLRSAVLPEGASSQESALADLTSRGWLSAEALSTISDPSRLTNGDSYMLIRDIAERGLKIRFDYDSV